MILGYCTNIHPAETWQETLNSLQLNTIAVRNRLIESNDKFELSPFPIGLRLSARAARELLIGDELARFKDWLEINQSFVFTINGFPFGSFHGTKVKEKVFLPDWTSEDRVEYTHNLFTILAEIAPQASGGSISTLPGSHKLFQADESIIRRNLIKTTEYIEKLSQTHQIDLHLGLEPEPLGHFENTEESLRFFEKLFTDPASHSSFAERVGINYDCCHFAIEFDDASTALNSLQNAGIRISKIHLSNALSLRLSDPVAVNGLRSFVEPTYFHQVITKKNDSSLTRFLDLPDFLTAYDEKKIDIESVDEARVHFHIPLDARPAPPLNSTNQQVIDTLVWCQKHPNACKHFEIETYTWSVLPHNLQRPVIDQIAAEYEWVINQVRSLQPNEL